MLSLFQIAAVSRRTGLSIDTIRAWERRHKLVAPARSPNGVREYSEADVERLNLARAAVALGHPIRHVAERSNEELRELIAKAALPALVRGPAKSAAEQTVESILDAVKHYDLLMAQELLNSAVLLFSASDVIIEVLAPLMREVGRRWEAQELSIAQEHFTSNLVRGIVGSLARMGPPKDREPIMFVTPPGESHEFGVLFAAGLASLHGFCTIVLGANVPLQEAIAAAKVAVVRSIVVGMVLRERVPEYAQYLAELRRGVGPHVRITVGGSAAMAMRPEAIPSGVQAATSLAEFSDSLRKMLL